MILKPEIQKTFWDAVGEQPNPTQKLIHELGGRFVCIGGGERGGKSRTLARHLFTHCHFGDLFWIVGPDYDQTHSEFEYCANWLIQLGELTKKDMSTPRRGSWYAEIDRTRMAGFSERKQNDPLYQYISPVTRIATRTAAEMLSLAAEAPDGVLIIEPGQILDYETIRRLRGRVGEKRGWIWMGGTFEHKPGEYTADWYRDLWSNWQGQNSWGGQSFSLPSWSNPVVYPGGRQDPEMLALEGVYPPDLFMERFGGRPYKPEGLVLKEFNRMLHVDELAIDPKIPIHLAIDPGYNTAYAVAACQRVKMPNGDDGVNVVDSLYERRKTAYEVIELIKKKRWWHLVEGGVIDIAGTQRQANKSQVEIWAEEANLYLSSQYVYIEDGILRHRNFLQSQRLVWDKDCEGIEEYDHWERDARTNQPSKLNCDLMKAINYYLIEEFGMVDYDVEQVTVFKSPFSF